MGVEGEVGPRLPGTPVSVGGRPQAIVTLGATVGGVLGGWLVDRAGRKLSLLLCTVPFVIGFAVITAAQDVWMLLGGRLLTGLACGVASLVAPVSVPSFTPWDKGKGTELWACFPPAEASWVPLICLISLTFARASPPPPQEPQLLAPFADKVNFRNLSPLSRHN